MPTETERLIVEINEKGALVVKRNIDDIGKHSQKTGTAVDRLQAKLKGFGGAIRLATTALAGFAAVQLIGRLTEIADSYTNIQNRLRTVTEGQEQLATVTSELFAISNRTRSSFEATAEVYARVGLAAKEAGRSQSEMLRFTESLNKAVILSGASAETARGGLIQLSQGLASGTLRGDELNSVMESLSVVGDVIAQQLGITRGELKKMGEQGKITGDIVLDAFKNAREELDERFAEAVPTVGQSFTVLRNNVTGLVGAFDQASGTTAGASKALLYLADNIRTIIDATGIAATAIGTTLAVQAIPAATRALTVFATTGIASAVAGLRTLTAAVAANPLGIIAVGAATATSALLIFADRAVREAEARADALGVKAREAMERNKEMRRLQMGDVGPQLPPDLLSERNAASAKAQADALRAAEQAAEAEAEIIRQREAALAEEEKRRVSVAESARGINEEMAREVDLLRMNAQEREVSNRLLTIEQELRSAGATEEETESILRETEAMVTRNAEFARLGGLLDEIRGPQEDLAQREEDLNKLFFLGAISAQQFTSELENLREASAKTAESVTQDATSLDGIGKTLGEVLFDNALDALTNFKATWRDFIDGLLQDLTRVAANAALSALFKGIGIPTGFQHGGSFQVGGSGGPDSRVVAFRASPGERVTVSPQGRSAPPQSMAPPVVNIINTIDPRSIADVMRTREGQQSIINAISLNKATVRQAIA